VPTLVFVFTLLVTGILVVRKIRGGILIGLVSGTVVAVVIEAIWHLGAAADRPGGWSLSVPALSGSPFAWPDLSLVGEFSLSSFSRIGVLAAVMLVFTLVFANFFDAMGTLTGLSREAGLSDEQGNIPRLRAALIVEGAGAAVGGATSASSNTVFIESGAGIEEGARTGLANLVTGGLFLAAMFISPLASIVPTEVAAAALVIVGALMVSQVRHIDIAEFSVALPVVLTIAVMPFSYSIANGIGVGFIAWVVMRTAAAKWRDISPLLWIVALGFVVYFARGGIESIIGM
jgi:AGZA family xanthine/uracil permease-like MFS transporter